MVPLKIPVLLESKIFVTVVVFVALAVYVKIVFPTPLFASTMKFPFAIFK